MIDKAISMGTALFHLSSPYPSWWLIIFAVLRIRQALLTGDRQEISIDRSDGIAGVIVFCGYAYNWQSE